MTADFGEAVRDAPDPGGPQDLQDLQDLHARLGRTLNDAARTLVAMDTDSGLEAALASVVAGARSAVEGVEASVSLIDRRGTMTTWAPSSESVRRLDEAQADLREGPCLDASRLASGEGLVRAPDLAAADSPWPRWGALAVEAGFVGVLSLHLVGRRDAGALNLYSRVVGGLSPSDELVAALYADQAAVALQAGRRVTDLHEALASRDVIGRAKGILAERFAISDAQAFALLVDSSQSTNMKLRDVARWLTEESETRAREDRPAAPSGT